MLEYLLVFLVELSMKIATGMLTIVSKVLKSIRLSSDTFSSLTQAGDLLLDACDLFSD